MISNNTNKKTVLLVEDDIFSIELTKKVLKNICLLEIAVSGIEAVEHVKANQYDAILMDINLGKGIDGVQATTLIRSIPGYGSIPIIALTSYVEKNQIKEFFANGCTYHIPKPLMIDSFIIFMKRLLGTNL